MAQFELHDSQLIFDCCSSQRSAKKCIESLFKRRRYSAALLYPEIPKYNTWDAIHTKKGGYTNLYAFDALARVYLEERALIWNSLKF